MVKNGHFQSEVKFFLQMRLPYSLQFMKVELFRYHKKVERKKFTVGGEKFYFFTFWTLLPKRLFCPEFDRVKIDQKIFFPSFIFKFLKSIKTKWKKILKCEIWIKIEKMGLFLVKN